MLVAKSQIARGTVFDQALADKLFETEQIPQDSLPPDRISRPTDAQLLAVYKGKVAATDIFTGTPLVSDQFVRRLAAGQHRRRRHPEGQAGDHGQPRPDPRGRRVRDAGRQGQHAPQLHRSTTTTGASASVAQGHGVPAPGPEGDRGRLVHGPAATPAPRSTARPRTARTTTTTPQTQPSSLITLQVTPRQAEQIVQGTTLGTRLPQPQPAGLQARQVQEPDRDRRRRSTCSTSRCRGAAACARLQSGPPPASEPP